MSADTLKLSIPRVNLSLNQINTCNFEQELEERYQFEWNQEP